MGWGEGGGVLMNTRPLDILSMDMSLTCPLYSSKEVTVGPQCHHPHRFNELVTKKVNSGRVSPNWHINVRHPPSKVRVDACTTINMPE